MAVSNGNRQYFAFKELKNLNTPWRATLTFAQKHTWPKRHKVAYNRYLYFLDSGMVRLAQQNMEGQEKILWFIGENCIFGETPFFDDSSAGAFFSCVTDCVVWSFTEKTVKNILREQPELVLNLAKSMAIKMRFLVRQAASLYLDNALVRVCKFLEERIIPGTEPPIVDLNISRQEIASFLGINRSSLYKLLREQEENGLLQFMSSNRIMIAKPDIFYEIINI